jgi:hypothetical protein
MTNGAAPVAPSIDPQYWLDSTVNTSTPDGWQKPSPHRMLDILEIPGIVEDYRKAAERARAAGFDGVELHAANGYLPDQFLQDGSNKRTDGYGGSIENRTRFLMEVVEALPSVWGGNRVAVRIGPGGIWNHMSDSNSDVLFDYVARQLNRFGLAYLHIIEPRVKGNVLIAEGQGPVATERLRKIFRGRIVAAGGFEPDTAEAIVEKGDADAVAFGRHFLANPDLPKRSSSGCRLTITTARLSTLSIPTAIPTIPSLSSNLMVHCPTHFVSNFETEGLSRSRKGRPKHEGKAGQAARSRSSDFHPAQSRSRCRVRRGPCGCRYAQCPDASRSGVSARSIRSTRGR